MPTIELDPSLQGAFGGVTSFDFPEGTSPEELNRMLEEFRASQFIQEPPPSPEEETRAGFLENITRGVGAGTIDVARGFTGLGDILQIPGAEEASAALGEFRADIAPQFEDTRGLLQIAEEDGNLAAVFEAGERLPSQIATFAPQILSIFAVGGLAGAAGRVLGASTKVITGLQAAGATAIGGAQEAVGTLEEFRTLAKEQGEEPSKLDETFVYATTLSVVGALNTIGLGAIVKRFSSSSKSFVTGLIKTIATGGIEAITEFAEEPANFAILSAAGVSPGEFSERMKAAFDVVPPAFAIGFLGGGAGEIFSPDTRQDIINKTDLIIPSGAIKFTDDQIQVFAHDMSTNFEEARAAADIISIGIAAGAKRAGVTSEEFFENNFPKGLTSKSFDEMREVLRADGLFNFLPSEGAFFMRSHQEILNAPSNLFNKDGNAPAGKVRNFLKGRIKEDEVTALGLDSIIPLGSQETVNKQDVLDAIAENTVQIRELPKGLTNEQILSHPDVISKIEGLSSQGIQYETVSQALPLFPDVPESLRGFKIQVESGDFLIQSPEDLGQAVTSGFITGDQSIEILQLNKFLRGLNTPAAFVSDALNIPGAVENQPQNFILTYDKGQFLTHDVPAFDDAGITTGSGADTTIGWLRTTIREVNGKKFLVIEEIQSDTGQAVARGDVAAETFPFASNWPNLFLSRALSIASARGLDGIMIANGAEQQRRSGGPNVEAAAGLAEFYDKILPNRLNKMMGRFKTSERVQENAHTFEGVDFDLPSSAGLAVAKVSSTVHQLNLNESLRDEILERGSPAFSIEKGVLAGELVGLKETPEGELEETPVTKSNQKTRAVSLAASKFLIRGYTGSNVSTFLHEFAHWALLTSVGDFRAAIEKAFTPGRKIEQWNMKDHERFARTFQVYMFHGIAPDARLNASMQVIRESTRKIYKTMRSLMNADPRFVGRNQLAPAGQPVVANRDEKFKTIDMLFEGGFSTEDLGVELNNIVALLNLTGVKDEAEEPQGIMAEMAAGKGRINGINIANLTGLISEQDMQRIMIPFLQNMERSGLSAPVPWSETIAKMEEEFFSEGAKSSVAAVERVIAQVHDGQVPPPHQILGMITVWATTAPSFAKIMTSDAPSQVSYDTYRNKLTSIMQDMGSMAGRALNTFKIFIAMKDLELAISTLDREVTLQEKKAIAEVDMTNVNAVKQLMDDLVKGKTAIKQRAIKNAWIGLLYNSMLFNPGTQGINFLSNVAQVAYQAGNRTLIGLIEGFNELVTGKPAQVSVGEGFQILAALMGNLTRTGLLRPSIANTEIMNALRGELSESLIGVTEWDDKTSAATIKVFDDFLDKMGGRWAAFGSTKTGKITAGLLNGGTRGLVAMDLWTKAIAREAYLGNQEVQGILSLRTKKLVTRQLRELGVSRAAIPHQDLTKITEEARETVIAQLAADETWIILIDVKKKIMRLWENQIKRDTGSLPTPQERLKYMTDTLGAKEIGQTTARKKRIVALKKQQLIEKNERLGRPAPTEAQLKAAETLTKEDLTVIREQAHLERIQQHWTFQDEPGKLTSRIVGIRDHFPVIGRLLVPFINTIMNITKRSAELLPGVGVIAGNRFGKLKPSEIASKQLQGIVLMMIVVSLMGEDKITGPPPDKEGEREANRRRGIPPWSIQLPGGVWVDYRRFDPWATPVAMTASMVEEMRRVERDVKDPSKQEIDGFEIFARYFSALSTTFLNTTWFDNVLKVSAGTDANALQREAARTSASLVPYSSMWRSIYRAYITSTEGGVAVSDRPSYMEMFASGSGISGITGIKADTKLTLFGEEARRGVGIPAAWIPPDHPMAREAASFLGALFPLTAPFSAQQPLPIDLVENEFVKLEVYPGMPERTVKLPGIKELDRFDDEVYRKFVIRSGHRIKEELERFINLPSYQRLTTENKKRGIVERLETIRSAERRRAIAEELKLRKERGPQRSSLENSAALARRIASGV